MSLYARLCSACAPKGVEQLSRYYAEASCESCGVYGRLYGFRLSVILEALRATPFTVEKVFKSTGGIDRVIQAVEKRIEPLHSGAGDALRELDRASQELIGKGTR